MTTATPTLSIPASSSPDSLKDLEALSFLAGQPAEVRAVWRERCGWLRWADQLAERNRWAFNHFLRRWFAVDLLGGPPVEAPFEAEARGIHRAWFEGAPRWNGEHARAAHGWSCWLHAIGADYGRSVVPATLEEHDEMVRDVGGFFALFPYLTAEHWEAIQAFGAVDQAWNNVRDIAEDAAAGRCYFPTDSLLRFGLTRSEVMGGGVRHSREWASFMHFWLGEHLPYWLGSSALPFLEATDLHPSVAALRTSCLRRYARIERVLRAVDFDYRAFPAEYEKAVGDELAAQALGGGAKEIA